MLPLSYHSSTQGSTHRLSYHSSTQESTHHSGRHITALVYSAQPQFYCHLFSSNFAACIDSISFSFAALIQCLIRMKEWIELGFKKLPMGGAALDLIKVSLPEETIFAAKQSDGVFLAG
ncbi:hypothetical protein LguiA_011961 [Lonicera macranthoides]